MKIRINREKFINSECPQIPKNVWYRYYYDIFKIVRNYPVTITFIDTIDIRINVSYTGSSKFHFYTSINKGPEVHYKLYVFDMPEYMFDYKLGKKIFKPTDKNPKAEGFIILQKNDRINCNIDIEKCERRKNLYWFNKKLKEGSKKATKRLKNDYLTFLRLKETFNY